jgi:hypothetical protein
MLPRRRSLSPLWNFCEDPDPWMYNNPLHPLSVSSGLRFEFFSLLFVFNFRFFSFFHRSRDPFWAWAAVLSLADQLRRFLGRFLFFSWLCCCSRVQQRILVDCSELWVCGNSELSSYWDIVQQSLAPCSSTANVVVDIILVNIELLQRGCCSGGSQEGVCVLKYCFARVLSSLLIINYNCYGYYCKAAAAHKLPGERVMMRAAGCWRVSKLRETWWWEGRCKTHVWSFLLDFVLVAAEELNWRTLRWCACDGRKVLKPWFLWVAESPALCLQLNCWLRSAVRTSELLNLEGRG